MNWIRAVCLPIVLLFFNYLPVDGQGAQVSNFGTNPGNLNCYKFVPSNMPSNAPLVVVLHGCGQTALSYATETAWDSLAKTHKFYVVYGEQNFLNNSSNCFNYWQASDCSRNQGEALSIKQMTDYMKSNYSIDGSRVFVTGLSAGGAMTAVMLSVYPDIFNAGAIMAGLPYDPFTALDSVTYAMLGDVNRTPQQWGNIVRAQYPGYTGSYPRMSVFQGTSDAVVNMENAHELVKQFANLHNCDTIADYTNPAFNGNNLINLQQYFDSTNHLVVQYYQISNMNHGIAVYPGNCYQQGGATDQFSFNESFYSSFWAAQFFGILQMPFSMNGFDTVTVNQQGLTYSVPNVTGATYTWVVPTGVTILSGQGSNSITVNWGNASGTISVSEKLSNGCIEGPVQIFVTALPVPPSLDAALSNLTRPAGHVCGTSINPTFTLSNSGQTTLTSLSIFYKLDNGALQTYSWTGSLAVSNSTVVYLPVLNASVGSHNLLIYCSAPNGGTDINHANDTLRGSFTYGTIPSVNIGHDTAQCSGSITLNAQNSGSVYSWSTGSTAQSITVTQTNVYSVTVTTAQSCSASGNVHVTINAIPLVTLQLSPDTVCESGGLVPLNGGIPTGGIYTGSHISNGVFDPAAAGYGSEVVSYGYTDVNGCQASASQNIAVVPCSIIAGVSNLSSPADSVCANAVVPSFTLTNLGQTNIFTITIYYGVDNDSSTRYSWSGNLAGGHSTAVTLPVLNTSPGNHVITIVCTIDTLRGSFISVESPVVNLGGNTTQCGSGITLNAQNNGSSYYWSTGSTVQSITAFQTGVYSVTVSNAHACSASDSILVRIDSVPAVTLQLITDTFCNNSGPIVLTGGIPLGGAFSGPDVVNDQFNPSSAGSGSFIINYTYTDINHCYASASQSVTVEVCSGIDNFDSDSRINFFPNPNSLGMLNVKADVGYVGKSVFIFDLTGRLVLQHLIGSESEQINILQLAAGVYFLNGGGVVQKMVVQ